MSDSLQSSMHRMEGRLSAARGEFAALHVALDKIDDRLQSSADWIRFGKEARRISADIPDNEAKAYAMKRIVYMEDAFQEERLRLINHLRDIWNSID